MARDLEFRVVGLLKASVEYGMEMVHYSTVSFLQRNWLHALGTIGKRKCLVVSSTASLSSMSNYFAPNDLKNILW